MVSDKLFAAFLVLAIAIVRSNDDIPSSLVRVCAIDGLDGVTSLGVLVAPNFVYTSHHFHLYDVYLMGGNTNMSCSTGQRVDVDEDSNRIIRINTKRVEILPLKTKFDNVTIQEMKHLEGIDNYNCSIFCNCQATPRWDKTLRNCTPTNQITKYDVELKPCDLSQDLNSTSEPRSLRRCFDVPYIHKDDSKDDMYHTAAAFTGSPVICGKYLVGFAADPIVTELPVKYEQASVARVEELYQW